MAKQKAEKSFKEKIGESDKWYAKLLNFILFSNSYKTNLLDGIDPNSPDSKVKADQVLKSKKLTEMYTNEMVKVIPANVGKFLASVAIGGIAYAATIATLGAASVTLPFVGAIAAETLGSGFLASGFAVGVGYHWGLKGLAQGIRTFSQRGKLKKIRKGTYIPKEKSNIKQKLENMLERGKEKLPTPEIKKERDPELEALENKLAILEKVFRKINTKSWQELGLESEDMQTQIAIQFRKVMSAIKDEIAEIKNKEQGEKNMGLFKKKDESSKFTPEELAVIKEIMGGKAPEEKETKKPETTVKKPQAPKPAKMGKKPYLEARMDVDYHASKVKDIVAVFSFGRTSVSDPIGRKADAIIQMLRKDMDVYQIGASTKATDLMKMTDAELSEITYDTNKMNALQNYEPVTDKTPVVADLGVGRGEETLDIKEVMAGLKLDIDRRGGAEAPEAEPSVNALATIEALLNQHEYVSQLRAVALTESRDAADPYTCRRIDGESDIMAISNGHEVRIKTTEECIDVLKEDLYLSHIGVEPGTGRYEKSLPMRKGGDLFQEATENMIADFEAERALQEEPAKLFERGANYADQARDAAFRTMTKAELKLKMAETLTKYSEVKSNPELYRSAIANDKLAINVTQSADAILEAQDREKTRKDNMKINPHLDSVLSAVDGVVAVRKNLANAAAGGNVGGGAGGNLGGGAGGNLGGDHPGFGHC